MHILEHFFAHQHDIHLVLTAAVICIIATASTLALIRLSKDSDAKERHRWLQLACVVSGFGIWSTHFVAMMGYSSINEPEYSPSLTALSLLIIIGGNFAAFHFAAQSGETKLQIKSGLSLGAGIALMHYIGMAGTEFGGTVVWNVPLILVSIPLAIIPNIVAVKLIFYRTGIASAISGAALSVGGTVALHFTGMAAFTVETTHAMPKMGTSLSSTSLTAIIGGTAFVLTSLATIAACLSARARSRQYEREREFRVLVQNISDCALFMLDRDGNIISWNLGAERMTGHIHADAIGTHFASLYPEDSEHFGDATEFLAQLQHSGSLTIDGWRTRKDGTSFFAEITVEAIQDEQGSRQGYATITRDVTQFKLQQDKLAATSAKLDVALGNMRQGLCLFDAEHRLILMNNRITELFGITASDCPLGTAFADVFAAGLEKRAGCAISQAEIDESVERHTKIIRSPEGGTLLVPFNADCTISVAHQPVAGGGFVTTFEDVTERHRAEQQIQFMALHDNLTGLPNRFNFIRQFDKEIDLSNGTHDQIIVVGIDLDGFKEINDFQGHAEGDLVLKLIGDRLSSVTHEGECVARFGGDEFAAFKRVQNEDQRIEFLERLSSCFRTVITLESSPVTPSASLGVSIYPQDGRSREQIINNADLAMYRAKRLHGTAICYYEQGMDEAARSRRLLANDLRHALERQEFSLAFQVQRNVITQEITGYEALLRWQHSQKGWVSPEHFIPLAEENGTILSIGEWVLRTACRAATSWHKPYSVAVNLSAVQLTHVGFLDVVEAALRDTGLPASRLELEITETAIITDKAKALRNLKQLKALGVSIAIDDFGTGYSSLDTLNSFPFDKIKIDKSFLLESDINEQSKSIIRAVLALGKSLKIPVLAEGLETDSQLNLLRDEGCELAQGYLWGRPVLQSNAVFNLDPDQTNQLQREVTPAL